MRSVVIYFAFLNSSDLLHTVGRWDLESFFSFLPLKTSLSLMILSRTPLPSLSKASLVGAERRGEENREKRFLENRRGVGDNKGKEKRRDSKKGGVKNRGETW